ncbi:MAG: hypothetical protein SNJ74_03585 [Fimbriimonadaceae bacterium]
MLPAATLFPAVGTFLVGRSFGGRKLSRAVRQRQTIVGSALETPGLVLGFLGSPPGQPSTAAVALVGAVAVGDGAGFALGPASGRPSAKGVSTRQ